MYVPGPGTSLLYSISLFAVIVKEGRWTFLRSWLISLAVSIMLLDIWPGLLPSVSKKAGSLGSGIKLRAVLENMLLFASECAFLITHTFIIHCFVAELDTLLRDFECLLFMMPR